MKSYKTFSRRHFLGLSCAGLVRAQEQVSRPVISEDTCPLEVIEPAASDGYRGKCVLRRPPGAGPRPAVVLIHGGLVTVPLEQLREMARSGPTPSRFLAAGYVVAVLTYRSRDQDPQSTVSLHDCLAVIDSLRKLSIVDPKSIVVWGCSGGGDLALEIAAATNVCAIVTEEPASFIFAGIFNASFPRKGERLTPMDSVPIGQDPKGYYTPECQQLTRGKIARIRTPLLMLQGDQNWVVPFNNQIMIPELRAAGVKVEVISYPAEPHCFAFDGHRRAAAALKAFQDVGTFYSRHLKTKPKPLDQSAVKYAPA